MALRQISVTTPSKHYVVLYGRDLLARIGAALSTLKAPSRVFLLSSPNVWKRWGRPIEARLKGGPRPERILFSDSETAKSMRTVESICRTLSRKGADRNALIVAVGGGVVGDVAGFVAATFLRGVPLVHVPTTLVAQVDSSIGGKTGVNLPEGKNLVGAFLQPELVIADPSVLSTLPRRQFRAGLFEVAKYGVIGDRDLFEYLEQNAARVAAQEPKHLDWVIPRCMEAKARVVSDDERESGLREVLNLGHTFAHALEAVTGYRRFLHGEAVGWGLMAAARLATRMELMPDDEAARVLALVRALGPLPAWPAAHADKLVRFMHRDKKARGGRGRFVLPQRIGKVECGVEAPETLLMDTLTEMKSGRFSA